MQPTDVQQEHGASLRGLRNGPGVEGRVNSDSYALEEGVVRLALASSDDLDHVSTRGRNPPLRGAEILGDDR
jgi:hypothetical protein